MGLILTTEYVAAVQAVTAYYARRGEIPETLALLAAHSESIVDVRERVMPALDEYAGLLPVAVEALLRDEPEEDPD